MENKIRINKMGDYSYYFSMDAAVLEEPGPLFYSFLIV
jgi:hypothetical protein